jgi:MSHA pilin protein MshC
MGKRSGQRAFTLVELITTIVILGIVAAIVAPRFFSRGEFESRGFHDQVISSLRYAQKVAIAEHRFVCVAVAANSVTLTYDPVPYDPATHPAAICPGNALTDANGAPYVVSSGTVSFSAGAPAAFSFDALGRASAAQSFSVAGYATPIAVEAETGYVH